MKLIIALLTAFSLPAMAAQKTFSLNDAQFFFDSPKTLRVVGTAEINKKKAIQVDQDVEALNVSGSFSNSSGIIDCQEKRTCTASNLKLVNSTVVVDVRIDKDMDGNVEATLPLTIGIFNSETNEVIPLNGTLNAVWVQDRYSFLEKWMGAEDRDYLSVEFTSESSN